MIWHSAYGSAAAQFDVIFNSTNISVMQTDTNASASIYVTSKQQWDIPYTKTVSFSQDYIDQENYPDEPSYRAALVEDLREQAQEYVEKNNNERII